MKAWVLHGINDIKFEEMPVPEISEREVLVKVRSCGICGSDIPRIYQTGAHVHPLIPGHEFSGEVVRTGSRAEKWLNKRVGVFPLIPCGKCMPCQKKAYEMCRGYSYLGSRRNGGFAEYAVVPFENLIELPENVTFEEAAMLEPMAVAVHAIRRVNPSKKDTVVVCGLGTIGLFTVMFLKEMGLNNILVIGNKDFQKDKILKLGIPEENYCNSSYSYECHKEKNIDIFFECVGKNETVSQAIEDTAPGGKVMLVGNPYSDIMLEKAVYWKILRNQLNVMGTWNSSFLHDESDDWHCVLNKLAEKKIDPKQFISHEFDLPYLENGLNIMKSKSEEYIKIIIKS